MSARPPEGGRDGAIAFYLAHEREVDAYLVESERESDLKEDFERPFEKHKDTFAELTRLGDWGPITSPSPRQPRFT